MEQDDACGAENALGMIFHGFWPWQIHKRLFEDTETTDTGFQRQSRSLFGGGQAMILMDRSWTPWLTVNVVV